MKRSVLIVEDDEMIREMMDYTLTQAGYAVATAGSGEAGLELARRMKFSVILLDINMPRMSGLDVLRALQRPGRPPVIMVTANRSADTVGEAVQLGCSGYLSKPFTPESLVQRVRTVLAGPARAA